MLTTVVGSYPVITGCPESIAEKIKASLGSFDPFEAALDLAVTDQVQAGIDVISDGQVRGSMLEIFAQAIPGMGLDGKKPVIEGKIIPSPYSIGAADLKRALKTAGKLSPAFRKEEGLFHDHTFRDGFKGVKGIITGPTTLALSSLIKDFYNKENREEIIIDLAWALKKEAEHLENAGAALIQVDEPFLSTGMADIKTARKALEIIRRNLSIPIAMHVCGDLTGIWEELLQFKVDILDCEFAGQPKNQQILENTELRGKKLGLGCIDSKTDEIESSKQIAQILEKGVEVFGEENIIADPDCGMRLRSREAAYSKLKVMVETVKWLS
jgi:5-methyltetrahydropteroyltriglutamate--homocysteine methyltransferase